MSFDPKNILILRLSSIGDILLTTASVRHIRTNFPNAHMSLIIKKECYDFLRFNPNINTIIAYDAATKIKGLKDLNSKLRNTEYDFIFDLHNNLRTNRMLAGINSNKIFKIRKSKIKRAALVYLKTNFYKKIKTIPERYLEVGLKCGIKDDGLGLELFLASEEVNNFGLMPGRFICIGPGAAHFTKMWPITKFEELVYKITSQTGYKVAILGSASEKDLLPGIKEKKEVINLCGKLDLLGSATMISNSAGMVSNDSGLMHMAAAVKKPVVAIFGSTVEELGFFPYRADSTIIENKLWCRPCSHVGKKKCMLGHFKCMQLTTVDQVFTEVKRKMVS